ncbi:MAG: ATP-dependent Clp protease ATP-binding subunit [Spirochaetia bacterium]|nr:ATP-dependent Clp protease ATP-binding subunit [Spirochaetota bacterium]MCX8096847.1 ATP-dependent Clp protease ATP-binding subunit [Spirochaetota bacterium]MDW8111781.1 ATP-dependent Clp protease ATP-binding subunit [Spirochaetia bacterium]
MFPEGLTPGSKKILNILSQEAAKRLRNDKIEVEHILIGIIADNDNRAITALRDLGVDTEKLKLDIENAIRNPMGPINMGSLPFSQNVKKVLDVASEEAKKLGHNYIGPEHILIAIMSGYSGIAYIVLENNGITVDALRRTVARISNVVPFGAKQVEQREKVKKKVRTPLLDEFGTDLCKLALEGKLDPVIGRDKEIERTIQVLVRRKKNNPVLAGLPGVGKTSIVEGLAQRIVKGQVPEYLIDKRVIQLNIPAIVAGTKYRGEFEDRLKNIINEIKSAGDVIVFIDEIHTVIGAGAAEGAIDAANILKPELSRGDIQFIGATTLDDYRKYIERDKALERRFQMILVEEPSVEVTLEILRGIKKKYEDFHKVVYDDDAIIQSVYLSKQYIQGRYLPDKAIDLIDEAGAKVRMRTFSKPKELIDMEASMEEIEVKKKQAVQNQSYEEAAFYRDRLNQIRNEYEVKKQEWVERTSSLIIPVTVDDIRETLSAMTGIPVKKLGGMEINKLANIETELKRRVIGQDEALEIVSKAIRRARIGLKPRNKPIGSFLFLGPTGVGKTELAKSLAEFLFGSEDNLIRLDMSEFMEKFTVSRLVGAPPGYVGYQEGGQLTEAVRRKPYAVILFDEIEKAHPDVFNILLQVMDDGRLTDSLNNVVNFSNTVIIMTSNLGVRDITNKGYLGFAKLSQEKAMEYENMKSKLMDDVKKYFSPEFLNRLDEIVVFRPLSKEIVKDIVSKMINEINTDLQINNISISITDEVKEFLAEKGFDPKMGARPLRKTIRKYIEDKVAQKIIEKGIDISLIAKENKKVIAFCDKVENDEVNIKIEISDISNQDKKRTKKLTDRRKKDEVLNINTNN